jgi:hypothetical protein
MFSDNHNCRPMWSIKHTAIMVKVHHATHSGQGRSAALRPIDVASFAQSGTRAHSFVKTVRCILFVKLRRSSSKAFPTCWARSTTHLVCSHLFPCGRSNEEAWLAAHSMMFVYVFNIVLPFDLPLEVFPQTDQDTSLDSLKTRYFILTVHTAYFHLYLLQTYA